LKAWPDAKAASAASKVATTPWIDEAMPATDAILSIASVFMLTRRRRKLASTSAWPTRSRKFLARATGRDQRMARAQQGEGATHGMAPRAEPETADQLAVGEAGQRHRRGDGAEHDPDQLWAFGIRRTRSAGSTR
jgi:hypothetical protein